MSDHPGDVRAWSSYEIVDLIREELAKQSQPASSALHRFAGHCPDTTQPQSRDPKCPACVAMSQPAAEQPAPMATPAEAHAAIARGWRARALRAEGELAQLREARDGRPALREAKDSEVKTFEIQPAEEEKEGEAVTNEDRAREALACDFTPECSDVDGATRKSRAEQWGEFTCPCAYRPAMVAALEAVERETMAKRLGVESCREERAAGNGGCGACALCCNEWRELAQKLAGALSGLIAPTKCQSASMRAEESHDLWQAAVQALAAAREKGISL